MIYDTHFLDDWIFSECGCVASRSLVLRLDEQSFVFLSLLTVQQI